MATGATLLEAYERALACDPTSAFGGIVALNSRLDAATAREWGLASAVFSQAEFEQGVAELAERLAAGPTRAYAVAKGLMNRAAGVDRLDHHLDEELANLVRIADGEDFALGIEAFFAKRPAEFQGRS